MYAADAALARLQGAAGERVAAGWTAKATEERQQADDIRHGNEELDRETQVAARRATFFDSGEVFLEIGIVLCSIALLNGVRRFWQLSFVAAAIGLAAAAAGFVTH
jgi:hypothetical protein